MASTHIGRWLFTEDGLVPGYLRISDGVLEEVCLGSAPPESERVVILPSFTNAHTHLGDAGAFPAPRMSLGELVAPPEGYKHRVLRSMGRAEKVAAMRESIWTMTNTGTRCFGDFREEGTDGIAALREAVGDTPVQAKVFGRPSSSQVLDKELSEILSNADGIGMSGIRDWPAETLSRVSQVARSQGKMFSIHASEDVREDIDAVLDLKPSFLVHMTQATAGDLRMCADLRVPIVVCPQTYEFFGIDFSIRRMMDAGLIIGLGTDNAMISRPDMLEAAKCAHRSGSVSPAEALHLAVFGGRKVLYANAKITTDATDMNDFVAVGVKGEDPLLELVTAAKSDDVVAVVCDGKERRIGSWMR